MYGDPSYTLTLSGSTATSANTAHRLFGLNNSLSTLLNAKDVVFIQIVAASGQGLRIGHGATLTNNTGLQISIAASAYDLPPIQVGTASALHLARDGAGADASALWSVWSRNN